MDDKSCALAIGIDIGTQSVKAIVLEVDTGRVVGRGVCPLVLQAPRPGAAEQDPMEWLLAGDAAVGEAIAGTVRSGLAASSVVSIGVSGQQHGCVVLDEALQPIRLAKLWCDTEASAEAAELSASVERVIPGGFTAPKVLWIARHEPQNFARVRHIMLPHDWFNLHLTGRIATDCGDASGTGYFDTESRRYDEGILRVIEALAGRRGGAPLRGMLPEILGPEASIGTLRSEVAHKWGLSPSVVVSVGSGDNMCSALGAGAVTEGTLVISLGTSGTVFGVSSAHRRDKSGFIADFCDATGHWLPLLCTMNCTLVTEEVRHSFGMDHDQLAHLALQEPTGSHGVRFLPYLNGERSPNWPHATGVMFGLRPGLLRPGVIYRAAVEGAANSLARGVEAIRAIGVPTRQLLVVGGAAGNPMWRRALADMVGLPLSFPREKETAALGAALQGAAAWRGELVEQTVQRIPPVLEAGSINPDAAGVSESQVVAAEINQVGAQLFAASAITMPNPKSSPKN